MNDPLTEKIIAAAFKVHNTLGFGFYERVYERALMIELRKAGIIANSQVKLTVYYEDEIVGAFRADIIVDNKLLIELKATYEITPKDEVQTVNYLKATKYEVGLLINFGGSVQVKRKYRDYRPRQD